MSLALETTELGKRYGSTWALRDCSLAIPQGQVAALVGPNGAGKTTLLHLATGILGPTRGRVEVFGWSPHEQPLMVLARVGFVAQDHPLYRGFTVAEMLRVGRKLNPRWDEQIARGRLDRLGIGLEQRVGKLSGGQQAQVALVLALAKRPELLVLDEPVASLDPLARREFLQALMDAVAEDGLSVLLSSHILADLERVCDYLVILSASRVQLAGDIDGIVTNHRLLTGPRESADRVAAGQTIVQQRDSDRQSTLLVAGAEPVSDPAWLVENTSLEEIVLGYLGRPASDPGPAKRRLEVAS
ncbi:MAG TPA: ABC transporter ATP-binding protein [Gaiellales bacterium]|nr:ABC transporter ATP-binding protein [Gaiellales bacterium]